MNPKCLTPKTSGSAFFCYAMAWGVNNGVLKKIRISSGRTKSSKPQPRVDRDGKLLWVQPIGAAPDKVTMDDTQEYGGGASSSPAARSIK